MPAASPTSKRWVGLCLLVPAKRGVDTTQDIAYVDFATEDDMNEALKVEVVSYRRHS